MSDAVATATGLVGKDGYERGVVALIDDARRDGRRIRLLFELGPDFRRCGAMDVLGSAFHERRDPARGGTVPHQFPEHVAQGLAGLVAGFERDLQPGERERALHGGPPL